MPPFALGNIEPAETILSAPAAYPIAAVLAAERAISTMTPNDALAVVADREKWFADNAIRVTPPTKMRFEGSSAPKTHATPANCLGTPP
jgi:hypothetical protein